MKPRHATGLDKSLPHLNAYWSDREERARMDAEARHLNALSMESMDRVLAPANAIQLAKWAENGEVT
jgi:hypothetical protein